jgi:hypothetical protein
MGSLSACHWLALTSPLRTLCVSRARSDQPWHQSRSAARGCSDWVVSTLSSMWISMSSMSFTPFCRGMPSSGHPRSAPTRRMAAIFQQLAWGGRLAPTTGQESTTRPYQSENLRTRQRRYTTWASSWTASASARARKSAGSEVTITSPRISADTTTAARSCWLPANVAGQRLIVQRPCPRRDSWPRSTRRCRRSALALQLPADAQSVKSLPRSTPRIGRQRPVLGLELGHRTAPLGDTSRVLRRA